MDRRKLLHGRGDIDSTRSKADSTAGELVPGSTRSLCKTTSLELSSSTTVPSWKRSTSTSSMVVRGVRECIRLQLNFSNSVQDLLSRKVDVNMWNNQAE